MVRVGIVGCGNIGKVKNLENALKLAKIYGETTQDAILLFLKC